MDGWSAGAEGGGWAEGFGEDRGDGALAGAVGGDDHVDGAGGAGGLAEAAGLEVQREAGGADAGGGDGDAHVVAPAEAGDPVDVGVHELDVEAGVDHLLV